MYKWFAAFNVGFLRSIIFDADSLSVKLVGFRVYVLFIVLFFGEK